MAGPPPISGNEETSPPPAGEPSQAGPPELPQAPKHKSAARGETRGQVEFPCSQCGAEMSFDPSAASVKCPYCSHEMAIPQSEELVQELDFRKYLAEASAGAETIEQRVVRCSGCGAQTTLDPNVASDQCPFCGSPVVSQETSETRIRPRSLLPFAIDRERAAEAFRDWIAGLWFAPNKLKQYARADRSRLNGMYVPYWTYDAFCVTFYRGQRGDDYYETERYTTTENGKSVTKTRQVRKTRWRSVSGTVFDRFDDVLVLGSNSLPRKYADRLAPWDLQNLTPYDEKFLSGFRTETYQIDLAGGFEVAKDVMEGTIRQTVKRDIGGDHQRIHHLATQHNDVTFKHILLPVWISAYRFRDNVYRFLVNARTGEVQGERPWSWVKIALLVLGIVAAIVILVVIFGSLR